MSNDSYRYFFKVVDRYEIKGRLIVVSDIATAGDYRHGEVVELHRPDGSKVTAQSFEVISEYSHDREKKPLELFFTEIKLEDIPQGTEVWLKTERPVRKPSRHYEAVKKTEAGSIEGGNAE